MQQWDRGVPLTPAGLLLLNAHSSPSGTLSVGRRPGVGFHRMKRRHASEAAEPEVTGTSCLSHHLCYCLCSSCRSSAPELILFVGVSAARRHADRRMDGQRWFRAASCCELVIQERRLLCFSCEQLDTSVGAWLFAESPSERDEKYTL